jgi:multidrug resistance protein, MATE family
MARLAIPSIFSAILSFLIEMINLIFVGHLNDPAKIAGVGMGNMTVNLLAMSIIYGMNSSLDTLISQASGSGNKELCGVYLNRGRFVMLVLFIPITCLLLNT